MNTYSELSQHELEKRLDDVEDEISTLEDELSQLENERDEIADRLEFIKGKSAEEIAELDEAEIAYEKAKAKIWRYYGAWPVSTIRDMRWWEVKS